VVGGLIEHEYEATRLKHSFEVHACASPLNCLSGLCRSFCRKSLFPFQYLFCLGLNSIPVEVFRGLRSLPPQPGLSCCFQRHDHLPPFRVRYPRPSRNAPPMATVRTELSLEREILSVEPNGAARHLADWIRRQVLISAFITRGSSTPTQRFYSFRAINVIGVLIKSASTDEIVYCFRPWGQNKETARNEAVLLRLKSPISFSLSDWRPILSSAF